MAIPRVIVQGEYLTDKELDALAICLADGGVVHAGEARMLIAAARRWNECRRSWGVAGERDGEAVPGGDANG